MSQRSWDKYFIQMSDFVKSKSKDRSTKVGAVIVKDGHAVIGMGFNGFPIGVNDDVDARHERPAKYLYTEHAERNAILLSARHGVKTEGATLYLSGMGFPCADCARAIIQSGIKTVIAKKGEFEGSGSQWSESCRVGGEMLAEAGVEVVWLDENFNRVS